MPIFQAQPGFKAYSVMFTNDEVISFGAWETAEHAEAANIAAADWVAEHLAADLELKEAHIGEIGFSSSLGVTTKARTTA